MKRLLLISIALFLLASCAQESGKTGEYVAKIDGTKITAEDVKKEMSSLPDMAKNFFQGPEGTSRFVDELVKRELLYLEAKKKGLDKGDDFQRRVEEFKKITLINQLLEKEIEAWSKVTDKDVKDYYDAHKDEFTQSNQVRLSQIVVKTQDDAKKVYERLKQGEDFGKVASALSIDSKTAKVGGDLGSFKRGEMARQLEEVAFRLKKGETSMPITLKDGVHILKVTDTKGSLADFDAVKGLISQKLTSDRQKEGFDKYIENLKKNYKIETNKDAISKLTAPPQKPEAPQKQEAPQKEAAPQKQEKEAK